VSAPSAGSRFRFYGIDRNAGDDQPHDNADTVLEEKAIEQIEQADDSKENEHIAVHGVCPIIIIGKPPA